jgi:LysM repeat protein
LKAKILVVLPINPERHLSPVLFPASWRRGKKGPQIRFGLEWFPHKWRFRLLSAALLLCAKSLLACGPWFPNNMLDRGDAAVLVAPVADFYNELDRIPASHTSARAVVSTNSSYAEDTLQAELDDLRAALRESGKASNDVERIVLKHSDQRAKLQKFASSFTQWKESGPMVWENGDYHREKPAGPQPNFPSLSMADGLPGEFADYLKGAIAWNNPGITDKSVAREAWEGLLNRPAEERHYKSVWAAFMLGRSWETDDPKKARDYYQQARMLAALGFADTSGLAASSLGWEARLALRANEFETALDLYLQQYAAGSPGAAESLKFTAAQVIDAGPKVMAPLVVNPQARQLITAYLISRHPYDDDNTRIHESTKVWLDVVEQANVKDVESAEQFALAAYQADDMESAIRWVNRAGNSPTAQWLTAKLLLRAGKIERATVILAEIATSFPMQEPTNEPTSFGDGLFVWDGGEGERVPPGRYILGELGALRLSRHEYVQALDLLLRGDFQTDAYYVADRVLTTDELKSYVDANWPAIPPSDEADKSEDEKKLAETTKEIRHLLARRLTRESHGPDARPYFPAELLPDYESLMEALNEGWNESLPGEQRAKALRDAAYLARTNGMQLLATETDPDWHAGEGNFGWRFRANNRTNQEDTIVVASADELKRNADSRPDPDKHFHYRYQAATLAWEAVKFMPNNSDDTARLLCDAGSWLKAQDPEFADVFYKALVRRCRKTALGSEADEIRWFPTFDENGNVQRTRLEMLDLPTSQEFSSTEAISRYPIPGKFFQAQDGDHIRYLASAVRRLGISMTTKDIFAANPDITPEDNITGHMIYIPVPGSDARPETPPAVEKPAPEAPSPDPNPVDEAPTVLSTNEDTAPAERNGYVVQPGDTLAKIAKQFGVGVGRIVGANSISTRSLKVGQRLLIPDL